MEKRRTAVYFHWNEACEELRLCHPITKDPLQEFPRLLHCPTIRTIFAGIDMKKDHLVKIEFTFIT